MCLTLPSGAVERSTRAVQSCTLELRGTARVQLACAVQPSVGQVHVRSHAALRCAASSYTAPAYQLVCSLLDKLDERLPNLFTTGLLLTLTSSVSHMLHLS